MRSTIFIPDRTNVGFRERGDTYTGKLAYVVYYDTKGVLRKETSWNSWRDQDIPNQELSNVPTSGFVLNKKAGGYSTGWNHRQTYCRVYDPRGFEFEIDIPNLLYILENTNSIKGKGLDGDFVYGWDGKDLILIPCDSPDYKELMEYNNKLKNATKLKGKDLIIGGTYLTNDNEQVIYMGRYDFYDWHRIPNGKQYFFAIRNGDNVSFVSYKTLSKLIDVVSDKCVNDYADIFSRFEYYEYYNPYDSSRDEYVNHTLESFKKYISNKISKRSFGLISINYYTQNGKSVECHGDGWSSYSGCCPYLNFNWDKNEFYWWDYDKNSVGIGRRRQREREILTIEQAFDRINPQYKKEYLADGKLRKVDCYE